MTLPPAAELLYESGLCPVSLFNPFGTTTHTYLGANRLELELSFFPVGTGLIATKL